MEEGLQQLKKHLFSMHPLTEEEWLEAQHVTINRIRIPSSITPLLKLKMGDMFGFIIAHHQRHFVQIEKQL